MASQVAVAEVAVVPTFKGFRKSVTQETDGSAKTASQGFTRAFSKTGSESGKQTGAGFKKAFEQSSKGTSDRLTKAMEANVAKTSRAVSAARLKEQDAAGKVRVAERQLAEAREKYARDSSQVVRAEERMATASRQLEQAHERTEDATNDLKQAQGELARAADRAGDEISEAGSTGVSGFRSNVVGGVKGFAGPLIAAFAALGIGTIVANAFSDAKDFVLQSVDFASDLNESVNAVEVAYGDAAAEVLKLGEASAQAFGLSTGELNAYATQFSSFVSTIAGSGGDVAGTLETLVGRGTDFASVFNLDVSEALATFQSGLAGETEPLRKYGIDLSAATVEAYALANGIGDGTSALTEAEKVQARYGSLLEQTNKVQGDFANTSDELANKNRINAAEWENLQAQIGDAFLPVASELASILGDDVLPVLGELIDEYGPELGEAFEEALPALRDLAEEVLPTLPGLFESVTAAIPPLIDLLTFLAPILTNVATAQSEASTMVSQFFGLLSGDVTVEEFGQSLIEAGGPIGGLIGWLYDLITGFQTFSSEVGTNIDNAIAWLTGLPERAREAVGDLTDDLKQSGKDLIDGFLEGMRSSPIGTVVGGIVDYIRGFFPNSPAKRGPLSGSGWTSLKDSGGAYWDQWLSGMGDDGPVFPDPPGGPGSVGGDGPVSASAGRGGRSVSQVNHFDKTDPREAAELANQMLASAMRGA